MKLLRSTVMIAAASLTLLGVVLPGPSGAAGTVTTERVSVSGPGAQADRASGSPSISADAAIVAFVSDSSLLVSGDTNNAADIFVRSRRTGATERISVQGGGGESRFTDPTKAPNASPSVSRDGRYVVFSSGAFNLAPGDTNELSDIFIRDRSLLTTARVSLGPGGAQTNGHSSKPVVTTNGRFIAFESAASNLVSGDGNGRPDVFVRDIQSGTTERVSIGSNESEAPSGGYGVPAISDDGRYVAFHSVDPLSGDDQNGIVDVYVRDRQDGNTFAASLDVGGEFAEGNAWDDVPVGHPVIDMSPDGRFIAFESGTPTLVPGDTNIARDVFLRDTVQGRTERVSVGYSNRQLSGASRSPSVSDDGRKVAFVSDATDAVAADTNTAADVFIRDRTATTTTRDSLTAGNGESDGASSAASMSGDGTATAFASLARNLVGAADTNNVPDVFVRAAPYPVPPPVPAIAAPGPGSVVRTSDVAFSGSAQPGTTVRVVEGPDVLGTTITTPGGSWGLSASLLDGSHSVFAVATADGVDSDPTATRTFTVDTSGPVITVPVIRQPANRTITAATSITVSGTSDPSMAITLAHEATTLGTTVADTEGRWSTPITPAEGEYRVVATASDGLGNSASSAPLTLTVDRTGPAAPVIETPDEDALLYTNPVRIAGTAEPGAQVSIYWESTVAGVTVADSSGRWVRNVTLADGENEILARSRDAAGNFGSFSAARTFTLDLDSTAPTVSFTTTDPALFAPGAAVLIEGAAIDDKKVVAVEVIIRNIQGSEIGRPAAICSCGGTHATWSLSPTLGPGVYRISAYAIDGAGLRSVGAVLTVVRL